MNIAKLFVLSLMVVTASPAVFADEVLDGTIEAFVVRADADGNETFADADIAKPGDVLEYVLTYTSNATNALANVTITAPVPAGAQFIDGSANTEADAQFEATTNGDSWQTEPVKRVVQTEDGLQEETVDPIEYTSVRWKNQSALQPGETREFRYRVRVANENS